MATIHASTHAPNPHVPVAEYLKSFFGFFGLRLDQQPEYAVEETNGAFQVRRYKPFTTATVYTEGDFENASTESFKILADYIFGANQHAEKIAMTIPVWQQKTLSGWTMTFILPSRYTLVIAPKPNDSRIQIHRVGPQRVATLRYTGLVDPKKIEQKTQKLKSWLNGHGTAIPDTSQIRNAQYDSPATIPFLRRNEAQIVLS